VRQTTAAFRGRACGFAASAERTFAIGIAELQVAVDYHKSRDTFLRELKALRPEWLAFEFAARQRKAVEFTLTGAAVRQTGTSAPGGSAHGRARSLRPSLRAR
jgi:hypothetical protein